MADEDKKKKTAAERAEESYEQQAQSIEQAGQDAADALSAAGQQYTADLNAANQARIDAYNAAQQAYKQRMDEGYTQFADIIAGEKKRADDAEQEAIAQRKAEQQAARWTGAGELAASIANLISVGGFNAVNQQYRQYSQDWMKKADENWRHNRARFDNLRDRQRALQQHLIQMKMGNAGQTLNMTTRLADAGYQQGATAAQTRYQTATAPVNVKLQTAEKAGAARTQGTMAGVNTGLHEKQVDAGIAQGWARINQGQAELDMKAQENGFVPDPDRPGKYKIDTDSETYKRAVASGKVKSGGGSSGGNWYNVTIGGQPYAINMNKESREQAMKDGKEEMMEDVRAMVGAKTWEEVFAGKDIAGNKGGYREYADIINALNGTGDPDEDNKVIADFYDRHRNQCERMGMHLYNVATGARPGISTGNTSSGKGDDTSEGWLFRQYQPGK